VFFVPTIFMGALFAHLIQSVGFLEGRVGRATAINAVGSAFAPVLFGIVLIPAIGTAWSVKLIVAGYVALAAPAFTRSQVLIAIVPLVGALIAPSNLQRTEAPPGGKLLEFREGVMDSVAVVQHADGNRSLLVNNRFTMGGTGAAYRRAPARAYSSFTPS
jgi:spermidine synthase